MNQKQTRLGLCFIQSFSDTAVGTCERFMRGRTINTASPVFRDITTARMTNLVTGRTKMTQIHVFPICHAHQDDLGLVKRGHTKTKP